MWRRLQPFLTWRRAQLWLGLVAVTGLILCFLPLFDLLGYEFSLVMAVVASLAAGDLAATYPERVRQQQAPFPGARFTIARLSLTTTSLGLSLLVLPLLFISANALRVRNCDYLEGLGFFLLGPVAAVAVASAWGLVIGLTAGGRRRATALWVLVWVGAIAVELHEGWATPTVRSFGSLHGYFSGVLYDEAVTIPLELVTFRLRDAVEVLALLGLCHWLIDRSELRLRLRGAWSERRRALLPLGAALVAALGAVLAPALGHRRDAGDVAEALGGRARFGRCVVIHADSIDAEAATSIARDCAFRLHQHEQFFDIRFPGELTVYLFADPEQKQELIGAGRTSVAKPWRREVYIQGAQVPHPVLSHEIAHVVTSVFGAQPLGVSGRLGGVLVSPGLVEGAAVAAAWDEEELTPHLWSKAMIELEVAPPLESVLGLDFLTLNASRAYVLAGSFSRYLIETHGPARYRQAYRTADPAAAYGRPVAELERQWRRFLEDVELRPGDLELARDRFDRPAVFGKVCAHEVAQLRQRARRCEARDDWDRAAQLRRKVVRYSARDAISRYELARTLLSADRRDTAQQILSSVAEMEAAPLAYRLAARSALADLHWASGRREEALERYREIAREPAFLPRRRLIAVKIAALEVPEREPYIRRFLLGGPGLGTEPPDLALLTLSELVHQRPDDALGHYLLGRQLWARDQWERAIGYLEAARRHRLPTAALRAENLAILAASLFHVERFDQSAELFRELSTNEELPPGVRAQARDWLERIEWEREQREAATRRRGDA